MARGKVQRRAVFEVAGQGNEHHAQPEEEAQQIAAKHIDRFLHGTCLIWPPKKHGYAARAPGTASLPRWAWRGGSSCPSRSCALHRDAAALGREFRGV